MLLGGWMMFANSPAPSPESVGCAKVAWGRDGEEECLLWLHMGLGSVGATRGT